MLAPIAVFIALAGRPLPRCGVTTRTGCCQTCNYPYLKTISYMESTLVVDAADFVSQLDSVNIGSGSGPLELQKYTIVNTQKLDFRRVYTPCHACVTVDECISNGTATDDLTEFIDECFLFNEYFI